MRTYIVVRGQNGVHAFTRDENGEEHLLKHVKHHSPTGFEIGYGGSGPADLALSILVDFYRNEENPVETAWYYHQGFKWYFLAGLVVKNGCVITEDQIKNFVLHYKGA